MKKILSFLLGLIASFYFPQQAGDVAQVEQKLNLSAPEVINFISNNVGEQNIPEFVNYLKGFNVGLKAYKITYYTRNENSSLVKATGLIMYPNVNYNLSTVVSAHGTTDSRHNVPSNLKGVMYIGFGVELSYALNGYIVMAPDYVGMGTGDGTHPYVHYPTEAGATIDFVKAANKVLTQLGVKRYNEYFLAGYSQGAHAAMSTLKKLSVSNPDNLYFKYAYMGDGPYDFSGVTLQKGVLEKDVYPFTSFIANVVNTCNNTGYQTYNNSISEVISAEYMDKFNYHVLQDNGGLLWGPLLWKKLFTPNFVNEVTNNSNSKLKQCLRSNDVYDWYNKTPTTLGHATVDLAIHPDNTSKTIVTQQNYYPWWDLNKYKLAAFYWGPVGHIGGMIPFVLASNAKFNTLRSGGIFNQWALLTSKNNTNNSKNNDMYSSQIKPDLKGKQLTDIFDFNKENKQSRRIPNTSLSSLNDGVYLLKIYENNQTRYIPYIKRTPNSVKEYEIVTSENNNILSLKINIDELKSINIFDSEKNLIRNITQEEYRQMNGIDLNRIERQNYTFEIIMQFYSLQFNKYTGNPSEKKGVKVFAEKSQIMVKSQQDLKNISIYSISGALIQNVEWNGNNFTSKNLDPGIYIVTVILENGTIYNEKIKI